jgi:XTP/dITP diphosphohydrolase
VQVVLASGNTGKLRELASLLAPLGFHLTAQSAFGVESVAETGSTFADNALLKARHSAALTGLPALSDDSGIEVDALEGRPGVFSARYAGEKASDEDNLRKLLEELREVPLERRTARYRCVIAFVRAAESPPVLANGVWEGRIIRAPRGRGGFGYDPIFLPRGFDRTAAELAPEEKDGVSHRGQALRALVAALSAQRPL